LARLDFRLMAISGPHTPLLNGVRWEVEHRRVAYEYQQVVREIQQSTLPFAPRYARMIREANWFPRPG
jgi:hypothetical protein